MPQLNYSQNAPAAQPGMLFDAEMSARDVVTAVAAVNIPFGVYCELNAAGQAVPLQDAGLSGTVTVTNGNSSITFSTAQTLSQGQGLQFSDQPGVTYYLAAAVTNSTSGTLTQNYTGTGGAGKLAAKSPYSPLALGISIFDPLGVEQNYVTWTVTTTLAGTVNVVSGSPTVTFSQNQNLAQGSQLVFSSQAGTVYFLAQAASGTVGTLTQNYGGTSNGAATATVPGAGSSAVGWRAGTAVPFLRQGRIWVAGDASGTALQYGAVNVHHSSNGTTSQGVFTFLGQNFTVGSEVDVAPGCTVFNPGLTWKSQYTDPFGNVFSVYPVEIRI